MSIHKTDGTITLITSLKLDKVNLVDLVISCLLLQQGNIGYGRKKESIRECEMA